jgi:hypothetical protein
MKINSVIIIISFLLSGCYKGYPNLGSGYKIVGEGGYSTEVADSTNTIMISEYILDYAMDSNFIVIAQSPPDSLPKMKFIYYSDNDRKEIAANKNIFRQYWIIDKTQKSNYSYDSINQKAKYSNIYGPYNKNQFHEQLLKLKVPEKLQLENE